MFERLENGLLACAARLTSAQYEHLQGGLKLLDGNTPGKNAWEKERTLEKANPPQQEKTNALEKAQALEKAESSQAKLPVKDSKRKHVK